MVRYDVPRERGVRRVKGRVESGAEVGGGGGEATI